MIETPYVFSDDQLVDIRRYCGYPPRRTDNNMYLGGYFLNLAGELEYALSVLTVTEGTRVADIFLTQLAAAEQEVFDARANLTNSQVSVITHNPLELTQRRAEFTALRLDLCRFLGQPPGPELSGNRNARWVL